MSQLIQRLDQDLAIATDRQQRAELFARKACALARIGRFGDANELISGLRSNFGDWSSGQTHVWIMIAEALSHWFRDLSPVALDRITRAQVLSVAMKYDVGVAISAAWKAHIEFEMSNFDSMLRSLRLARAASSAQNSDANARVAIVICNALSCCGEWGAAQEWFTKGRRYAVLEGDQSGIEALQYNRAALAITWIRSEHFDGKRDEAAVRAARRELDSARNYSALTGNPALGNHMALCDARLTALEERFSAAAEMLRVVRTGAPFASYHFSNQLIDLEIAYCQFKAGDLASASKTFQGLEIGGLVDLDIDDRFAAVSMMYEMSCVDTAFGNSQRMLESRNDLKIAHDNSRFTLRDGIREFLSITSGQHD